MNEEQVLKKLTEKFPFLNGNIRIARARRLFAEVPRANFREIMEYAHGELGFTMLCTITGVDDGGTIGFIYHFAAFNGVILNVKYGVPKDKPVTRTVSDLFPSAEMYEREIIDLLGAKIEGLKEGRRYPLPEDWPECQYPLRKDWDPKKGAGKEEVNKNG
ncbi:MAG: NADH-quinone oxidoreductase subunit C [Endomicrobiales bacterium]|nr:NADH-quinone oxidoreductase subunit C [Endomicrobiales bacterium]